MHGLMTEFLLTNVYNANMEKEQVNVLNKLITISNFEHIDNHNVIFAGDFNIFFGALLDSSDTPTIKSQSINKLKERKETLDLCDIKNKKP